MKIASYIFLICVMTIPFWGSYVFFHVKKYKIKQGIECVLKSNTENGNLVELAFTLEQAQNELNWEHSREFEFGGQMYDIVFQRQLGDSVYYTCYPDHKETRLNAEKEKLFSRAMDNDPFQKKQNERISNFFKTVFQDKKFTWNPYLPVPSIFQFSIFNFQFSFYLPSPPTPPPESDC